MSDRSAFEHAFFTLFVCSTTDKINRFSISIVCVCRVQFAQRFVQKSARRFSISPREFHARVLVNVPVAKVHTRVPKSAVSFRSRVSKSVDIYMAITSRYRIETNTEEIQHVGSDKDIGKTKCYIFPPERGRESSFSSLYFFFFSFFLFNFH